MVVVEFPATVELAFCGHAASPKTAFLALRRQVEGKEWNGFIDLESGEAKYLVVRKKIAVTPFLQEPHFYTV